MAATPTTATAAASTTTYEYTGDEQVYVVPDGVTRVSVTATGGPGGVGMPSAAAGRGAEVSGEVAVTPGSTLYLAVGGSGIGIDEPAWNGGGAGVTGHGLYPGGRGGGASDVRTVSRTLPGSVEARVLVAGGGGGAGWGFYPGAPIDYGVGGDAGQPGGRAPDKEGAPGGLGGQPGSAGSGGVGGQPVEGLSMGPSYAGAVGTATEGGAGGMHRSAGGGGGGGYGGGGGGGGGTQYNDSAGGGGGGGGGSLVPASGTFALAETTVEPQISVTPHVPEADLGDPIAFADVQPIGLVGPGRTVTVENVGRAALQVDGFEFVEGDVDDFFVSSSTCGRPIAAGGTCRLVVRFVPQASGARSSVLQLISNHQGPEDVEVTVSGTGGQLPTGPEGPEGPAGDAGAPGDDGTDGIDGDDGAVGPAGPAGVNGASGPAGPLGLTGAPGANGQDGATGPGGPLGPTGLTGATGPAGPATVYRCRNVTVKRKGKKRTELKCSVQVKAAARSKVSVRVTRNGRTYARATVTGTGRTQQLPLRATRAASVGTYRITVRVTSRGGRTVVGSTATYRG